MLAQRPSPVENLSCTAMLESLPLGIAVVESQGTVEQINLTLARLFQTDRSLIVGQPLQASLPIESALWDEAVETCQLFGEADLPAIDLPSGGRVTIRVAAVFSDPRDRVIVTFTPVGQSANTPHLAELVRTFHGRARPLEARLRAALADPGLSERDLREVLAAALDPRPDDIYTPAQVLQEAVEWASASVELAMAATVPRRCTGDPTDLHTVVGALLAEATDQPEPTTLSVRFQASAQQLVLSLSPCAATQAPPILAAIAESPAIHVHADGQALMATVTVTASDASEDPSEDPPRLLMVEDDPVSALLARGQLERLGVPVDHASTGTEALLMLQQRDYPVVLLDCLLPDMDGRAVFDVLRAMPAERRPGRIIATSGMMGRVLPGGMADAQVDAVLPKPIRLQSLQQALGTWPPESCVPAAPLPTEAPILETATISALHSLIGGREVVNEVLNDFIDDLRRSHTVLARALGDGDLDTVRRTAHRLKGAAATVGARRVESAALGLERAAREEDIAGAAREISTLVTEAQAVSHALADLFV